MSDLTSLATEYVQRTKNRERAFLGIGVWWGGVAVALPIAYFARLSALKLTALGVLGPLGPCAAIPLLGSKCDPDAIRSQLADATGKLDHSNEILLYWPNAWDKAEIDL
ncbi:MAG: hypothetical protein AB7F31_04850 [Parachlamydiales bacterium]